MEKEENDENDRERRKKRLLGLRDGRISERLIWRMGEVTQES